jgi:hypothetical protein
MMRVFEVLPAETEHVSKLAVDAANQSASGLGTRIARVGLRDMPCARIKEVWPFNRNTGFDSNRL